MGVVEKIGYDRLSKRGVGLTEHQKPYKDRVHSVSILHIVRAKELRFQR